MTSYYRNRETGIIQSHPQSGLGETFNSDEIGLDGKPVRPFVALPITNDKVKDAKELMKDKTPEAKSGHGSDETKQGGDQ